MKLIFLTLALLIGCSGSAEAGPIATAIAAISSWTVAGVAVGSILLNMAVSVAMSALSRALAKKPEAAGLRTETTLNGEATPGSLIFGRYATAGFMVAPPMTAGSAGGMPNGFLTYVIEVSDSRVDGLDGVWINDDKVELLAPAAGDMYPDHQRAGGKFAGRAWFKFFDGTQTTAATANLSAAGGTAVGRPWQADMIGRGVAYAVARFRFDRELFTGFPQVLFEVRGLRLYDPRKDSTVGGSGTHRWGQPATYEFTENPAVMVYNILRGIALDDGLTWGGDCAAEDLPVANWFAAMNECDVLVDGEPQYRAGYEVRIGPEHLGGDEPAGVIEELLRGCAGQITEYGGVYKIRVGGPGMPVTVFSDDDIIITQSQQFEPFPPLDQVYNAVQAQHPEPAERWASKEAPPRFRSDYAAEDGQVNVAALRLPSVTRGSQAQRIMRAYLEEERRFRRHDISLPPDFARVEPLDAVAWTSSRNGYVAKVFEVASQADDQATLIQRFGLRERDPSDYDWAPGMALPVAIGQPGTPVPPARQVLGFEVAPYVIIDETGGPRRAGVVLTWDGDQPDARAVQWQIRPSGQTALVAQGSIHDVAAGQMVTSEGLSPNTDYEVRARLAMDAATEWTAWLPVTTPDVLISALEVDLAATQAQIDAAEAEALAASQAAQDALSAANGAMEYTDTEVAAARADLAVDFQAAIDAAGESETAMLAAQDARDLALGAAGSADTAKQAAQDAATAAEQAKSLAEAEALAASNSAGAAAGSASTATSKATEAEQSATAAAAQVVIAITKAGEASTSASNAAQSETNAAGSASAAASSATVSAQIKRETIAMVGNPYFANGKEGWVGSATDPNVPTSGTIYAGGATADSYLRLGGQNTPLFWAHKIPVGPGRSYRAKVRLRRSGNSAYSRIGFACYGAGGVFLSEAWIIRSSVLPPDMVWLEVEHVFDLADLPVDTVFIAPAILANTNNTRTTHVDEFSVVDATEAVTAEGSATAAATSASNAEASETAAGQSASSASQSATAAANSATTAGQSATAAAGSASTASTKADEAEQSATAAASSATQANTARSGAETAATQASASKTDAETAASSAQTSQTAAANSATAAGQSASAASTSASQASTSATNAGTSAAAAQSAKTAAETARSQANIARDDAVVARTDAQTAAAGAQTTFAMTAEVASRGIGVIADQFLVGGWSRWSAEGSLTRGPNEVYPVGETWDFTVTNAQNDGMQIVSTDSTWPGQTDAAGYVVEMEYRIVSGSTSGAGFFFRWSSAGDYDVAVPLSAAQAGVGVSGKTRTARFVAKKPSNFTGTFASNRLYFFCNIVNAAFGARAAKRIKVHRINIRVATEEELGRGEVMAEVQATLNQSYLTSAQTNSAISSSITSYDASLAGLKSNVTNTATALANHRNAIASFQYLATTGSGSSAGIRAVSISNSGTNTNTSISALTLVGDNVIAPGTLSTNALVVGLGKNLLIDPAFDDGLAHYSFTSQHGAIVSVHGPGTSWSHPGWPTLQIVQSNATSTGYSDVVTSPIVAASGTVVPGVPVEPGRRYMASAYFSTHRCNTQLFIHWYDVSGNAISAPETPAQNLGAGSVDNPDGWPRYSVSGTAPTNARYARLRFRKYGTDSGTSSHLFIWKPQLEECHPEATQPSPWSPGGTTYINGGRLFANSVTAREVGTETLTATHMVKTANLITHAAQIKDLTVDTIHLKGGAVTLTSAVEAANKAATDSGSIGVQGPDTIAATLAFNPLGAGYDLVILWGGKFQTNIGLARITLNNVVIATVGNPDDGYYRTLTTQASTVAGTNTLRLVINHDGSGQSRTLFGPFLVAMVLKK